MSENGVYGSQKELRPLNGSQETFHSPEEVEYYVQNLRRVQLCQNAGMSEEDIAAATGRSLSLVREYLELIRDFNLNLSTSDKED